MYSDELVNKSLTNSPIEHSIKYELISKKFTYLLSTGAELVPELVKEIFTNSGLKIVMFLEEHPVFVAPTIYHSQGMPKQVVDPFLNKLQKHGFLIRHSKITLDFPPRKPGIAGRRPPLWYLSHLMINSRMDHRVRQATKDYWRSGAFNRYFPKNERDKSINHLLINSSVNHLLIVNSGIVYYTKNKRFGQNKPGRNELLKYLETNFPPLTGVQRADVATKLDHRLYIYKEEPS